MDEKGFNPETLAKKAKIGVRTIYNYLGGKSSPTSTKLQKLAMALDVSISWLVGDPETPGRMELNDRTRRIPVVSFARAGEGANFDDLANHLDETVQTDSRDPNAFAMIVEGESMIPAFMPGDRVVIEPNSEARSGDVVLARELETGNVWMKKLKLTGPNGLTVLLISFNPDYEPIERPRQAFRFIYPVVERKLRR